MPLALVVDPTVPSDNFARGLGFRATGETNTLATDCHSRNPEALSRKSQGVEKS